jgi:hypothetical protein
MGHGPVPGTGAPSQDNQEGLAVPGVSEEVDAADLLRVPEAATGGGVHAERPGLLEVVVEDGHRVAGNEGEG